MAGQENGVLIRLEGVTKSFIQGGGDQQLTIDVLKGVDLELRQGELTALQGTSGSGKSTLLHILGLLDRPSHGRYLLRGDDVSTLDDDALSALRNRSIGFVFQSFYLIPYATALDNVLMPGLYSHTPGRALKERARELLHLVGLEERVRFRPGQLSGGQQQRVALARALINDPELLLADEPTGQLDSATSQEIMELIQRINSEDNRTVIIVTHDELTASYARRVVRVQDGRVEG